MNRMDKRLLLKAINSWKALLAQAQRSRRLLRRALKYDIRTRFETWMELVKRRQKARLKVANALHRVFKSRRYATDKPLSPSSAFKFLPFLVAVFFTPSCVCYLCSLSLSLSLLLILCLLISV